MERDLIEHDAEGKREVYRAIKEMLESQKRGQKSNGERGEEVGVGHRSRSPSARQKESHLQRR